MTGKRMLLGVFEVLHPDLGGTVSWAHPLSQKARYAELDYWVEFAKLLESADFDFLFFADTHGAAMIDGRVPDFAIRSGSNLPGMDPSVLISALAHATDRLGLVLTASTTTEHPASLARRLGTLDRFAQGRLGWNVVTGAKQDSVAALFGHEEMIPHDERYDMAQEHLELCQRYWNSAWGEGGFVADAASGVFAEPESVHKVEFEGKYFRSSGYYFVPPSPQRSPVILQAGGSERGRDFAAKNAECVFVQGATLQQTGAAVSDIRRRVAEHGRDPDAIKVVVGCTVLVAPDEAEALSLREQFDAMQTDEIAALTYRGNTGIDLLSLDPDRPLPSASPDDQTAGQMGQSNIDRYRSGDSASAPTVRMILDEIKSRGTRGFAITGNPVQVADRLERILDETEVDGVMLEPVFPPWDVRQFIELVQPVLERRGRLPDRTGRSTLRQRLLG